MTNWEPKTDLDPRYSSPEATPVPWSVAREALERAELFWLATVRPDGRPHVTPLIAVWHGGMLYFCTGEGERKAKNLAQNIHCTITTGANSLSNGMDVVIEGETTRVRDAALLGQIAAAYERKYGSDWHFVVVGETLRGDEGNVVIVFSLAPSTGFGFSKGEVFSQSRWRFAPAAKE